MELHVMPRYLAQVYKSDVPWAAISISSEADWPELSDDNRVDLLRLKFADEDSEGGLDDEQAGEILEFVRRNAGRIDRLVFHCLLGQSRSPAVAAAIYHLMTNEDDSYYFRCYTPNRWAYRKILNVAHERGYDEGRLLD